jgi:HAD superfamily hydrolase (TIGR01549 family)
MTSTDPEPQGLPDGVVAVLFDFDGPLCPLFGDGRDVSAVAAMKRFLRRNNLLEGFAAHTDTHRLLREIAQTDIRPEDLAGLDRVLVEEEIKAAEAAEATDGVVDLIWRLQAANRSLAIATNNSLESVVTFLRKYGMEAVFDGRIFGRGGDPALMKPDPHCLNRAITELGMKSSPGNCLMVGDSENDLEAAKQAGVRFLAFAVEDDKAATLAEVNAPPVARSVAQVISRFEAAGLLPAVSPPGLYQ